MEIMFTRVPLMFKYWYLFCQNCTNKSLKDLCREGLTNYECAKKQTYRNNLKINQKETNEIQTMCHIPDEKIIKDNQCTKAILRGGSQVKHTKMRKDKIVKNKLFKDKKMESVVTKVGETRDILSHGVQPQVRKALSHGVCPIPKPPVILGKKTLQNYSSKFKHTILSTKKLAKIIR